MTSSEHTTGHDGSAIEAAEMDHDGDHGSMDHGSGDGHAGHGTDHSGHELMFRKRFWVSSALSIPVLFWSETIQGWFNYSAPEFTGSSLIVPVLATVIFVYGGFPFLSMAKYELKNRAPAMMTLISLAIIVAYGFSMLTLVWDVGDDFFWELVTLIDIMLFGHWMEMKSVREASGALGALAKLMPDTAEIESPEGIVTTIPADNLTDGQTMLIRPGASVPADGKIIDGESDFDEALITGESRPVKKTVDAMLIAGTINSGSGAIRASVTATGENTTLSGIMKLVAAAEASKSPTQLLADRAASILFYAAVIAAALTAIVWTAIYGGFDERTIARVVTVLVIACPHALGLAIPLVVSNTTAKAAENGILISKREAIDTARDLNVIVFDKTGTLTTGQMGVAEMAVVDGVAPDRALGLAAAVESDSEHPIARAIVSSAQDRELEIPAPDSFEALKGRGVKAIVGGSAVFVGGPRLLESLELELPRTLADFSTTAGSRGESVVFVIDGDAPIAAIAISDIVRPESFTALKALKARGIEVGMITGDSDDVAQAVAKTLDMDIVFSQVLPADKDEYVSQLQAKGSNVGMVGDGVNDAPALTRANIGIAIGSGTDVAVQAADLVLVKSDPRDVVKIVRLSAASMRKQLQNIWWGAGYNIIMVPLAAGVLVPWGLDMPPAVGAAFMSLSTIIVAINAQTLRRLNLDVD
ncbi:MAG: copper-translocating P-type ATPase [Actinomycetia bacterium]|nr:copper-translocating P-type ATPase [Actinomycetes bacterium]